MNDMKEMDLRDWFAAQALAGLLANPVEPSTTDSPADELAATLAEEAYIFADAMLKARLKPRP
jgi:hypothetical protein